AGWGVAMEERRWEGGVGVAVGAKLEKSGEDSHGRLSSKIRRGRRPARSRGCVLDRVAGGTGARLRVLQAARAADLPAKARRPYPLLRLPCGEQQRVQAGTALARRQHLERGAVAQELRDGVDPGEPGRSRDQPAAAAAARARGGRQRLSLRRAPVRVQGRPEL